jgi:uncharacterized protein
MAGLYNIQIPLAGRQYEYGRMRNMLETKQSELVAVVGRRRVGKTFLIKKTYENEMAFHITGIQDVSRKMQLENFVEARNGFFPKSLPYARPKTWFEAFAQLKELLGKPSKKRRVLFFDEFPWLASGSKEFLKVFDHFWNSWAVDQNLVVVICGSSASWMIENVINHKGGLHNRVTQRIHLKPFTLQETEEYFLQQSISMPRLSIVQIYKAMGGIPFYLREVQKGDSAAQAIDKAYFGKNAALYGEFDNLYKALFTNHQKHIEVIRALASKWKGLSRYELIEATSMKTGGGLSAILSELEASDFIQSYLPFGKKERDKLYRLTDEYSLFYLRFIEPNKTQSGYWLKNVNTPTAKAWGGYAFESLVMKHIEGVKRGLGISGIHTQEASFLKRKDANTDGCQIDMLIDRADNAICICEMKFSDGPHILTAEDVRNLQQKRNVFALSTGTRKQLFITLITTQGLYDNPHAHIADKQLDMNVLFYESKK